jgi:hypothetical protein
MTALTMLFVLGSRPYPPYRRRHKGFIICVRPVEDICHESCSSRSKEHFELVVCGAALGYLVKYRPGRNEQVYKNESLTCHVLIASD